MSVTEVSLFDRDIAGVRAPDSRLAREAMDLAREVSPTVVFNHVMRTYYFGRLLHQTKRMDDELVFISAVLHDIGLTPYAAGPRRFEVEGADAARRFMDQRGAPSDRSWFVWDTIAMHTSDLNDYRQPEAQAVEAGIHADMGGKGIDTINRSAIDEVLAAFPRDNFKKDLFALLLKEAKAKPHVLTFHPTLMIRQHCCGGVEIPDAQALINAAPFAE